MKKLKKDWAFYLVIVLIFMIVVSLGLSIKANYDIKNINKTIIGEHNTNVTILKNHKDYMNAIIKVLKDSLDIEVK